MTTVTSIQPTTNELLAVLTNLGGVPAEWDCADMVRDLVSRLKLQAAADRLENLLINSDSYKASHWLQYPPGTEYVYSYIESRGGVFDRTVFFGLQAFLKKYLSRPITKAMIDDAEAFWTAHGEPFNREGWEYILRVHGGKLPVEIKAVPEGTVVPGKNILVSIVNTDPVCFWLPSYLETTLLRAVWYGTTVATLSYECKQIIYDALVKSCDNPDAEIAFRLHDFGARGVSSFESAGLGGMAHLVNFLGTDTATAIQFAREFYDETGMPAFSVPAAEHSTITSWLRENEVDAYRNMLNRFAKPGAIVAVVSDSYDLWNAIDNIWGGTLKQEVIDSGATLVVRPDSGDPTIVPVQAIVKLAEKFGYTINSKGYKVLPKRADGTPIVRVIQGDGINIETIPVILANLLAAGFSAENLTFGMGGGLLQLVNRDTLKFAMKCSAIRVHGVWRPVFKDPVTDPGKTSKKGRLALVLVNGVYQTVPANDNVAADVLELAYRNGDVLRNQTFADVRQRAA